MTTRIYAHALSMGNFKKMIKNGKLQARALVKKEGERYSIIEKVEQKTLEFISYLKEHPEKFGYDPETGKLKRGHYLLNNGIEESETIIVGRRSTTTRYGEQHFYGEKKQKIPEKYNPGKDDYLPIEKALKIPTRQNLFKANYFEKILFGLTEPSSFPTKDTPEEHENLVSELRRTKKILCIKIYLVLDVTYYH